MKTVSGLLVLATLVSVGSLALHAPSSVATSPKVESVLNIEHDHDSGKIGRRCTFYELNWGRRVAVCSAKRYKNHTTCDSVCVNDRSITDFYYNNYIVCYVGTANRPCKGAAFVHNGELDDVRNTPSRRLSCGSWEDTDDPEHGATCGDPAGGAIWDKHDSMTVQAGCQAGAPGWYSTLYFPHVQTDDGQSLNPFAQESTSNYVYDAYGVPDACLVPKP